MEFRGADLARVGPQLLLDQMIDHAVIVLDGSGTIETWNSGAERLHGWTADEAVGRSFSMLYADEDRRVGVPLQLLETARADGRVDHRGYRLRSDGSEFWGDVVLTALHDDGGRVVGFGEVVRDRTDEHSRALSLQRDEQRFRLLVSQVKDYAIIALDPSGTIESWNAGAERLKGYSAQEAIGRSFSMFYSADDRRAGLPLHLLSAAREQGSVEHTGWRVRQDGTRFWGDVIITAIHDENGQLSGFAKVTRDLTERKRMEDAQTSFLSAIAHDFRTPITAMKGFTELMRDAPDAQRDDFLRRIDANADRLMQMMRDLVGYASLHSISTDSRPEAFDLAALTRDTIATMGSEQDLARVVLPTTSAPVRVDRSSMERVVTNLVGNALKYSESGPISVDVSRGDDRVRLSVADQGRGIDPDDLEVIFEEFERGRFSTPDGGTGLGLPSVKRLVEEQGGRVHVKSVVGQGTVFTVELPAPREALRPVTLENDPATAAVVAAAGTDGDEADDVAASGADSGSSTG